MSAEGRLEVRGLVRRFGALLATDQVSLDFRPQETHAIIGPNGAGKSTLINLITGDLAADAGQIVLDGEDITALSVARRSLKGLARSFQITELVTGFTALDNVCLAVQGRLRTSFQFLRPAAADRALTEPAQAALAQVGLAHRAGERVETLSHGEKRQLEIAIALALEPKVLLLDEPMAGMGEDETHKMVELLQGLKHRYTILLVEHDMHAVFALADRISVLTAGHVLASDTPDAIRNNPAVQQAYLGGDL
jgi:branched-chain amino acid transport system ATP-binding protein